MRTDDEALAVQGEAALPQLPPELKGLLREGLLAPPGRAGQHSDGLAPRGQCDRPGRLHGPEHLQHALWLAGLRALLSGWEACARQVRGRRAALEAHPGGAHQQAAQGAARHAQALLRRSAVGLPCQGELPLAAQPCARLPHSAWAPRPAGAQRRAWLACEGLPGGLAVEQAVRLHAALGWGVRRGRSTPVSRLHSGSCQARARCPPAPGSCLGPWPGSGRCWGLQG